MGTPEFQAALDEVTRFISEEALPKFQELVNWLITEGVPKFQEFSNWMRDEGIPAIQDLVAFIGTMADTVGVVIDKINELMETMRKLKTLAEEGVSIFGPDSPFGRKSALSIIDRAAAFGDAQGDTWGFAVWGDGTDGSPKCALTEYSTSDYEYAASLAELEGFERVELDQGIYNNAFVRFINLQGIVKYRTPTDNASLTDAASIAAYGQRDIALDAGYATTTTADYFGIRFITRHKEPRWRVSGSIKGQIRNKQNVWTPCNQVRAGQRIKVLDVGETYFLRNTSYNADSGVLRFDSEPTDDLDVFLTQRDLETKRE